MERIIYLNQYSGIQKFKIIYLVSKFLSDLVKDYPRHNEWYIKMVMSTWLNEDRNILVCINSKGQIIGVSILKSSLSEKKICTLRVANKYQNKGIGRELVKKSFVWLDSDKPIVSVSESKKEQFDSIFKYFGFKLEQECIGIYQKDRVECVYNGVLSKQSLLNKNYEITASGLLIPKMGLSYENRINKAKIY